MAFSRVATLKQDGKVVRTWDLHAIRTFNDARAVNVGDSLEWETIHFEVTYIGEDPANGEIAWCGKMYGALERYGVSEGDVVAWGPRGLASTFPQYKERKFITRIQPIQKTSYLWT